MTPHGRGSRKMLALQFALGLVALAIAAAVAWHLRDMGRAYERIGTGSSVASWSRGSIEYARSGSGAPVLVIHGSGGGHDQGRLIAEAVLGDGLAWIAPSRMGYLRSTLPARASFDDQAQAYAELLDHLGIARVAVVAMSHGGPSALLFALLHPERVSSLTLISCGVASSADTAQAGADAKGSALVTVFSHDALYWATSTFFERPLMRLMGASDEVIAGLTPGQRRLVERVIGEMNPVAPRATGVAFDHRAEMPDARITGIRVPTLVLHARDDGLQLYRNAEYAAARIPGARLLAFERGGHLLIAVEQDAIRAAVRDFIRKHG
jgi:2-hydroxy-6-oxonona-2,4-dienedioate hydrolase